jgi:Zn-dependent metalloprotease
MRSDLPARCTIVPPYLLEQLVARTDEPELATGVLRTRELDDIHRSGRMLPPPQVERAAPVGRGAEGPRRTIWTADGTTDLPGHRVRREGEDATGDAATDEAFDWLGATWRLYGDAFGRDSLDGHGLPLDATVHYGTDYDNAFWDGSRMVFGDGDGRVFRRFTVAVDVVGHELTHGVVQYAGGLTYSGQAGSLNESLADVFGSLVKQHHLGQDAAAADWLIGAGLFTERIRGRALRSMAAPGTAYDDPLIGHDPQPASMSGYVETTEDDGGVHINSGIPNHAFYLAATAIGGHAWEGAGRIWYDVLTAGALATSARFADFAWLTIDSASRLFGPGSHEAGAVRDAWDAVQVQPEEPER